MTRFRTVLTISALAAAAPALAGEITGNGDSTPIRDFVAGSICSFSGLNDEYYVDGDLAAGRVLSAVVSRPQKG